ncbi:MAG: aminotransferase class III-fold pyridoxal phosphate-dependent enzyme [Immundisolibacterales bacterium]|nr:aminotransferase class III-fold pyridoxal phosphate-dependent enzyme [Immundisolibacterales bacterium]
MEVLSNSRIEASYRERTRRSAELAKEARELFPSGITHDSRKIDPYTIYVDHAEGPRKWDVDGNEYIDYFGGHGALMLGHHHPEIDRAVADALARGTHFGSSHEGEVRWAQEVKALVPSAERVRFTSSGTEATHLALRVARAATGRRKLVRFRTHFHGWHDHMTQGYVSHFDGSATPGVLEEVADSVVLLNPGDEAAMREAFASDADIAAAILEPTGSSFGLIPLRPSFLEALREATRESGAILIFDEVVTGFRVSPGGAQGEFGIRPDLTTLAKILAGGLPGGALVGRKDLLDFLDFEATAADGREKINHQGTYNANPVSAAAGTEMLRIVGSSDACARANDFGERLRAGLNDVLIDEGVPWAAYGTFSGFHVFLNPEGRSIRPDRFDPFSIDYRELKANPPGLADRLRLAMLSNGVDVTGWPGGTISAAHGDAELTATVEAFRESLRMLKAEDAI